MAEDFRVIEQHQTLELGADRRFHDVLEVTYETTRDHVRGTISLPLDQASPEDVSKAIQARVDLHKGIADL